MSSQNSVNNLWNKSSSNSEKVYQNQEGCMVQIPSRSRRGRKSSRKSSHPLRDIRLSQGMTLEELSDMSKLSPSYLSRLESGTRRLNVDTIDRLSKALQCNPSDLLVTGVRWEQIQAGGHSTPHSTALGLSEKSKPLGSTKKLPIYNVSTAGAKINFSTQNDFATCPPALVDVPSGYALRFTDNAMSPRFRKGDLIFAHPGSPLNPSSSIVIITTDQHVIVGEFLAWRLTSHVKHFFKIPDVINTTKAQEQYALELKRYNPQFSQQTENITLHPQSIISVARIVDIDED
jgi:transcriptional regulator with XRE-family HTH domain